MLDNTFHTTHWTAVLAAKESGEQARLLCETYYQPVRNFIQKTVAKNLFQYGSRDADDLVHDFFIRIIQGKEFKHLERNYGRFRSYLLGAVKFFLTDVREKESAQKRGGSEKTIPLDTDIVTKSDLDVRFDRDWAESLIARSVKQLRQEAEQSGQGKQFEVLRHWLIGDAAETSRDKAADALGVTKEHLKVLISRLRKKFRAVIRAAIAATVETEADIAAELDYLIRVLR